MRKFHTHIHLDNSRVKFLSCVYIYLEIGSSYTWCNVCKVTHFLHRKFLKDLTIEKTLLNVIHFPLIT